MIFPFQFATTNKIIIKNFLFIERFYQEQIQGNIF